MANSTIFSTRRGFLYQDRVALLVFLDHFQSKNISSFYVDYPLNNQKSLDIRLNTKDINEKVYEVKSGEQFKLDKRKKASSEVRDAIKDLINYSDKRPQALCFLIISKNFRPQIAEYWEKLILAKGGSTLRSPRVKSAARWLFKRINTDSKSPFDNLRSFHRFCLNLEIDDYDSDRLTNKKNDKYPPIDDKIIGKIKDILTATGATACSFEYDEVNLFFKLLCVCRENSGSGKDIFPILKSAILEFICHRKYLDKNYKPKGNNQTVKDKVNKEVEEWFRNWWEPKLSGIKGNQSNTK